VDLLAIFCAKNIKIWNLSSPASWNEALIMRCEINATFSGLSPEEKLHGVKYIIESFVGCIKQMVLKAGKAASDLLHINPLIATKHENVVEGCIDK